MAVGPGKYDAECSEVQEKLDAEGVFLIVVNGKRGSGFSAAATLPVLARIPEALESMAKQIREDYARDFKEETKS